MGCKKSLKMLSESKAVSGFEYSFTEQLAALFEQYCDEVAIDKFYNIVGFRKGKKDDAKKILVTAHYDEIGLIVTEVDKDGFLRFSNIGGVDPKILLAQEVTVHGRKDLYGVIGAKPPHLLDAEETKRAPKLKELSIDIGLSKQEAEKIVTIGDVISFLGSPLELKNKRLASKSLDNRSGVAVLLETLKNLKRVDHHEDIYIAATVQEEVGLRGAITAAFNIEPDLAIVIDVCHGDIPDVPKDRAQDLGKGPAIGVGPNLHKVYTKRIMELAKEEKIPYQIDVEPGNTGTEAWAVQISRQGVPTILLSIPLRYMHTTVETVSLTDIRAASKLVSRFCSSYAGY